MIKNSSEIFSSMTIRSHEHLASAIKRIRKLKKMSQTDLSEKTGLTQATISRIENANQKTEIGTLFLVLSALGADMEIGLRVKVDGKKSIEGLF